MLDLDNAIQRYLAGESINQLARQLGVGRRMLDTAIRGAGIKIRSMSEACQARSDRFTVQEKRAYAAAAQKVRRGKANGVVMGERRAHTIERLGKANRDEALLAFWLAKRGYIATLHKAIGIYNVDLGFEELRIAVEINGTAHLPFFATRQGDPLVRLEYILNAGWSIIEIVVYPTRYNLREIATDHIITFLQQACCKETTRGEHRVITGRGEPLPCTSYNSNNWPLIRNAIRLDHPWREGKRISD